MRRLSTRSFVYLALAAVLGGLTLGAASAATVTATLTTVEGVAVKANGESVTAGLFTLQDTADPTAYVGGSSSTDFVAFCVDLHDGIGLNEKVTWDVRSFSQEVEGALSRMFSTYLGGSLANASSLGNGDKAAMQLAVWEIVYDTGNSAYDLGSGSFNATGTDGQILNQAQDYLTGWAASPSSSIGLKKLVSEGTCCKPGKQDLLVQAVPLPAAAWLFGSGLLGVVTVGWRKKGGARLEAS
ncbi:hypothetical protein [Thiorhodococcus minor]|uniref:Thioester domain-containing protein n=1 Tax=Thiorhodococcus minor TaxID=57489 RepID=A0A6M0JV95_9GAMM|nr:hypothetical protein [Thiorhodococcus minor]NEV61460.1 hypothetical protein [Thiorhodococcus minor]